MRVPGTTTPTKDLGPCPACGKPIVAAVEVNLSDLRIGWTSSTVNVKPVGLSISHDCRTKATDEPTKPPCDRDHDDEWVEVNMGTLDGLPNGKRVRREWVLGAYDKFHLFVHRDDLPDTTPKEETR